MHEPRTRRYAQKRCSFALLVGLTTACRAAEEAPPPSPAAAPSRDPVDVAPKADLGATAEPQGERSGLMALARETIEEVQSAAADPFSLIPARAGYVARVEPVALFAIPKFNDAFIHLVDKSEPAAVSLLSDWKTCGLVPSELESITVAGDDDGLWAAVVRGKGVGKADNWRCARTMMVAAKMDPEFEIKQSGDETVWVSHDDGGRFVDDDTLVFFDGRWENEVTALIGGTSTSNVTGSDIGKHLERIPKEAPAWSVVVLSHSQQVMVAGQGYGEAEVAWVTLQTGEAFTLEMSLLAPTASMADAYRDAAQKQWKEIESFSSAFGLPSTIFSKTEFETDGKLGTLRMRASQDQVEQIAGKIKELM